MSGIENMNEILERRGPGRPRQDANIPAAPQPTDLPQRSARKPFGSMSLKLDYPQREGFHRHWFNDIPGRVDRAKEAGYENVKSNDGKPVSRVVGVAEGGGALTAYLMEIPEEWYQQDIAQEQNHIAEKEAAMKRGVVEGAEGGNQYVPSQGISIRQGK